MFFFYSKRDIAAANFVMHEVHCRRNIVLCKICDEPYPRSEMNEHIAESHADVYCDQCHEKMEKQDLEKHLVRKDLFFIANCFEEKASKLSHLGDCSNRSS